MRQKGMLKPVDLKPGDRAAVAWRHRRCLTHNARTEINKVRRIIDHDCDGRSRAERIRVRRAGTQQHNLRSGRWCQLSVSNNERQQAEGED
jgi:hypothetical protein